MKIGLLDHMGYGNLGDAATQDAVITNINRRLPDAEIVGFSLVPQDTAKRHGIPCYPIRRCVRIPEQTSHELRNGVGLGSKLKAALKKNRVFYQLGKPLSDFSHEAFFWIRSYRILRTLDIVIISGGGQFDDLWPDQPYTLFVFALLTRLARKKLYLLNVGVGPLRRRVDRIFAKWVAQLAHYRSVRDHDSQQRLMEFGVKAETDVYPDLVYSLTVEKFNQLADARLVKPIVGLNPTGFCDPRIWPRKNDAVYQNYINKLSEFLAWLLDNGYDVRLFSTDFGVDKYAIEDLRARLCSRLSPTRLFHAPSEGVNNVLREMAEFDVIVTSKFHGIIFSHLLRKPVISLSYHQKMDRAMEAVSQGEFCADIGQFDIAWLMKAFSSLVDQSSSLKRQCSDAVGMNAAKLSQQFDKLFSSNKSDVSATPRRAVETQESAKCCYHSEAGVCD